MKDSKELIKFGEEVVYIHEIRIVSSRIKGSCSEDSDLDVVIECSGVIREDALFNILNQEPLQILDKINVDFNPIMETKLGSMKEWLESNFYEQ